MKFFLMLLLATAGSSSPGTTPHSPGSAAGPDASVSDTIPAVAPAQRAVRLAASFGFKCDGTTDDTPAMNAALAACRDGCIVELPPGRCRVSNIQPPKWRGNGGRAWAQITIRGAGAARVDDILGAFNFGSTLYMPHPAPNVPVLNLVGTRGVRLEHLNVVGAYPPVARSVGIWLNGHNKGLTLEDVTIAGFAEHLRVGTPDESTSGNDDEITIRDTFFLNGGTMGSSTAIANYGSESYSIRASDCSFMTTTMFLAHGKSDGTVMNSFKCTRCFSGSETIIKHEVHGGSAGQNSRDIYVIDQLLWEPSTSAGGGAVGRIFITDSLAANNPLGLVITNSTLNTGADVPAAYDPAFRIIRYYGRGPFIFKGNKVGGCGRLPFEIVTNASGWNDAALSFEDNVFTTARPFFIRPPDEPAPALYERGNIVIAESKLSPSDPYMPSLDYGEADPVLRGGRRSNALPPRDYETWLAGSTWVDTGASPTRAVCRQSGTSGTIRGVSVTLVHGADVAQFAGGSNTERRKLRPGQFIRIGGEGIYEVRDLIGGTLHIHPTYPGPSVARAPLEFARPRWFKEQLWATKPPSGPGWSWGDVAWAAAPDATHAAGWSCANPSGCSTTSDWTAIGPGRPFTER